LTLLLTVASFDEIVAEEPVLLRVESLLVSPTAGPLVHVDVKNPRSVPYQGAVSVKPPEGWRLKSDRREVSLAPGETARMAFAAEKGINLSANRYPVEVSATGGGATVVRRQEIVVASAPFFKPTIDGDTSDWKDAIPVSFVSAGKTTTLRTYWNRRSFAVLVEVQEDKLVRPGDAEAFDAVQLAISPQGTATGTSPEGEATRFEFLLVADGEGKGRCFRLATPGMKLAEGATARALDPLVYEDAELAVVRSVGVTRYECQIPFREMREAIQPSEGREFGFSVLVHDPDGTGIRDWGEAAGLWPCQRNPLAWSKWKGARFGDQPPLDNKVEWGFCSSQY
jgi:hypothetical protein